jgi:translocation and assembly module TamB
MEDQKLNGERNRGRGQRSRLCIWAGAGVLIAALCALFLQSAWFGETLRKRLVAEMEKATGGRVELQSFSFNFSRLQADLHGLAIHGREEAKGDPPLFSADLVEAAWTIESIWSLRADLRSLRIWRPRVSVVFRGDGTSNVPSPGTGGGSGRDRVAQVLAFRVGRLEVLRGQVHFETRSNAQWVPVDLQAENVHLALESEPGPLRYAGTLDFQKGLFLRSGAGAGSSQLSSSGKAKFHLSSQKAEIESLELRTRGSHLLADGTIEDFLAPRLQFHYDLLVDWKEAAALLGRSGWQGEISSKGQASYNDQRWQITGPVTFSAMKTGITSLPSVRWSGRAALHMDNRPPQAGEGKSQLIRTELKGIDVAVLGGRLTGEAAVEMAAGATPPAIATHLNLRAERLSLPALLAAQNRLPAPLARLPWAGSLTGPVEISFTGSGSNLASQIDWQVDPAPVVPSGFMPVSGILHVRYQTQRNRMETTGSYLNIGQSHVSADGWLDDRDSRLSVKFDTPRWEDLSPLAAMVWKRSGALPFVLHGRATSGFLWTGGAASPRINGNVRVLDFEYRNVHGDSFSCGFDYRGSGVAALPDSGGRSRRPSGRLTQPAVSPAQAGEIKISSGRLVRGGSAVDFSGSLGLTNGEFTRQSPFSVQASLHDAKLEDLEQLAGVRVPIRGTLEGTLEASGTQEDLRGHGNLSAGAGEAYGETFDRLAAQVTLESGGQLSLRQLRLQKAKGTIEGDLSIAWKSRQLRFSLAASGLALESFNILRSRFPGTGLLQARLSGEGPLRRPAVRGTVEISRLAAGGQTNGQLSVGINTREEHASLEWKGSFWGGEFTGSGDLQLRDQLPFSARFRFGNMDLVSLLSLVHELPLPIAGRASGEAMVEGTLEKAQLLRASGSLDTLAVSAPSARGRIDFRNAEPVRFRYEGGAWQLERMHLTAMDTDLEASGTVSAAREHAVNLAVKGHADLAALGALDPDLSSSGQVSLDASLYGTLANPLWRGRLEFSDANLRYGTLPNGLSKLKGTLLFEGNRASLENMTAESGGGSVKLGGLLTWARENGLGGQLEAVLSGVRVRYPEGVSTWLDGRLTLSVSPKASLLAGKLEIVKESANPEFDVGAALLAHQEQPLARVKAGAVRNMRLDLDIVSAPNVSLETRTAKNLQGDVELHIQGSVDHPSWLGRISILQGEINIGGRRYLADRGELTFTNPFRFEPVLNLEVRARVEQYDIGLRFSGPLDRLTVTYNSDPPLPTSEILALLVAGSSYATTLSASHTGATPEIGAGSLLSQALNQQVGNRLDRIFGSGHIRIDMQTAGFDRPANANVAFEQHIKDNLTLLYVTNVTSAQQNIIQADLSLSPRFSVTAIRDQNGLIGVNFQIKLRFH